MDLKFIRNSPDSEDFRVEFDYGAVPQELHAVLLGMEPSIRQAFKDAIQWFAPKTNTVSGFLSVLNYAFSMAQNRLDEGKFFLNRISLSSPSSGDEALAAMSDYLSDAVWMYMECIRYLEAGETAAAVDMFGGGCTSHGVFRSNVNGFGDYIKEFDFDESVKKNFATKGGNQRAENYKRKMAAGLEYFRNHISESLSAPEAAKKIMKEFPKIGVSSETLVKAVREAKKKQKST